jgi:predicted transcriptional regulator
LRSDNRTDVLSALDDAGPLDRYELEDRLDASRRTVTRILGSLAERGYLSERGSSYALSAFGAALARAYDDYRETAGLADRFRPLLRHLDADRLALDPDLLRDAELIVATESSPYAILDRVLQLRAGATRVREMAPTVEAKSLGQLAERIEANESFDFEVVIPAPALDDAAAHPGYADTQRTIEASEAVDLYVYPEPFSFVLGVIDGTAVVGVEVDDRPYALVEGTRPELLEWVESRLDEYRGGATPIDEY